MILCDAQTSGGLLIAVAPQKAKKLLAALARTTASAVIGEIVKSPKGRIRVSVR
jgi:selenide,water dikinase